MHYRLELMLVCVRWYAAYPLSLRHVEEMMDERGVFVDHATVHRWAMKILPILAAAFRRRKPSVAPSWRMDETYIKVGGALLKARTSRTPDRAASAGGCEQGATVIAQSGPQTVFGHGASCGSCGLHFSSGGERRPDGTPLGESPNRWYLPMCATAHSKSLNTIQLSADIVRHTAPQRPAACTARPSLETHQQRTS